MRFREQIPHADGTRVLHTVFGPIEVDDHEVRTDDADHVYFLERNGFVQVDDAPQAQEPEDEEKDDSRVDESDDTEKQETDEAALHPE